MSNLYLSNLTHEEIALKGARLIAEFFPGSTENCLLRSTWDAPDDTALVYGDLFAPVEQRELFKKMLRKYYRLAGVRELSYVEYFDGGADPIWVMLVEVYPMANLPLAVNLCKCASLGWSLRESLKFNRDEKRWLESTLKVWCQAIQMLTGVDR